MDFVVRIGPRAEAFLTSLSSQDERDRLVACWDELRANPYPDHITKRVHIFPPLVFLVHYCEGLYTSYKVRGDTVEIYNASQTDAFPRPW